MDSHLLSHEHHRRMFFNAFFSSVHSLSLIRNFFFPTTLVSPLALFPIGRAHKKEILASFGNQVCSKFAIDGNFFLSFGDEKKAQQGGREKSFNRNITDKTLQSPGDF